METGTDGDMARLRERIAKHPFLGGLDSRLVSVLADAAMGVEFQAGEQIFREGDPANRFYLIEEGRISLESTREGPGLVIQVIGAGDVLGWSWLFPPYEWHFDARAIEPVRGIFFYGSRLREQCETDHDLGYELLKRMAEVAVGRLQAARRRLVDATPPK